MAKKLKAQAATKAKAAKARVAAKQAPKGPMLSLVEVRLLCAAIVVTGAGKAAELAIMWNEGRIDEKDLGAALYDPTGSGKPVGIGEMRTNVQTLRVQLLRAFQRKLYTTGTGRQLAPAFDEAKGFVRLYAAPSRKAKVGTATNPAGKSKASRAITSIANVVEGKDAEAVKAMKAETLVSLVQHWFKGAGREDERVVAMALKPLLESVLNGRADSDQHAPVPPAKRGRPSKAPQAVTVQ